MTSSVLGQADLAFPGEKTVVDLVGVQAGRVVTASFRRSPATKSSSPCLKTEVTTRYGGSRRPPPTGLERPQGTARATRTGGRHPVAGTVGRNCRCASLTSRSSSRTSSVGRCLPV